MLLLNRSQLRPHQIPHRIRSNNLMLVRTRRSIAKLQCVTQCNQLINDLHESAMLKNPPRNKVKLKRIIFRRNRHDRLGRRNRRLDLGNRNIAKMTKATNRGRRVTRLRYDCFVKCHSYEKSLTLRIRRRRAGSLDDTTDAIRAVACIRFVMLLHSNTGAFFKRTANEQWRHVAMTHGRSNVWPFTSHS